MQPQNQLGSPPVYLSFCSTSRFPLVVAQRLRFTILIKCTMPIHPAWYELWCIDVELERYQPDVVGAIFDLSYKYCAWSAACATMRMNNKILKRFASVKIFGDICAPIEAGAQLTGREVAKARGCLGHQSLALINVSAEKFCEMLVSEVLIWLSSVASTKRASLSFSW